MEDLLIGQFNLLTVTSSVDRGFNLDGGDAGDIFLANSEILEGTVEVGSEVDAFIYVDSSGKLLATTIEPLVFVGEFAFLRVVSVDNIGAFLDWGLTKDLFLPFREQTREVRPGQFVVVHVYLDNTNRISSSMRVEKFIDKSIPTYKKGEKVELLISAKTDLGFKAIINDQFLGMLFSNEVFEELRYGRRLPGFIKNIREDGKIDLSLQALGHKASGDIGEKIVELLNEREGFLAIDDKTSAETIYELFGVSKRKYKMALGGLYKKRVITIEENGIRLVENLLPKV